ncbi:MAG TPA: PfkB family carbohydrate kinase [Ignavibacteria bacterium]|nr:PfkB family carbohydrate kinase [Ignavibacteria bacterium]
MEKYISVIGGINIDIKGVANSDFKDSDSHQGIIHFTPGGVARNISENLARLGVPVYLMGCVGTDSFGNLILDETKKAGVNTDFVIRSETAATAKYLSVSGKDGKFFNAVNDMKESTDLVNIDYIRNNIALLEKSSMIVADANLNKSVLEEIISIANQSQVPILLDAVSSKKAIVLKQITANVDFLSVNSNEFKIIFGKYKKTADILDKLFNGDFRNFKYIILKKGSSGVNLIETKEELMLSCKSLKNEVVEPNGAGDAFIAGFLFGMQNKFNLSESVRIGTCVSYYTLGTVKSVSDELDPKKVIKLFQEKSKLNEF